MRCEMHGGPIYDVLPRDQKDLGEHWTTKMTPILQAYRSSRASARQVLVRSGKAASHLKYGVKQIGRSC